MLTRRSFVTTTGLGGLALAATAAGPAIAASTIKIGLILPSTGFLSSTASLYRVALDMALNDINAQGGVNGAKLEFVVADDQGQPAQSALLFRKLLSEGVVAVLGPVSGTSWEATAPVAEAMRTVALCWTALKSGISRKPYAMRIQTPSDTLIPEGIAELVKAMPNLKRVVVSGDEQEASSAEGIQFWAKAAKAQGLDVLDIVKFQSRTSDLSPIATKIRSYDPDVVLFSSLGVPAIGLVKELEVLGFTKPLVGDATVWTSGSLIQSVGSAGRNLYTVGYASAEIVPGNDKYNSFVQQYLKEAAARRDVTQPVNVANCGLAYDAVMLIADLLRVTKVDATSPPDKARDVLKSALSDLPRYDGFNAITMRPNGDGHIQAHLMKAYPDEKMWKFALPYADRITRPAPPLT